MVQGLGGRGQRMRGTGHSESARGSHALDGDDRLIIAVGPDARGVGREAPAAGESAGLHERYCAEEEEHERAHRRQGAFTRSQRRSLLSCNAAAHRAIKGAGRVGASGGYDIGGELPRVQVVRTASAAVPKARYRTLELAILAPF